MDMSAGDDDESMDGAEGDESEESNEEADVDAADSEPEDDPVCLKHYSNQHGV